MFTQPQMYTAIARKEPVFKMYCKQLLDEGWHVDGLNKERETPLHWAANLGQTKAVQLLLSRFADPTLKDRWGHTAATQALNKGHYAIADMLEDGEDRWDEIKEEREQQEEQEDATDGDDRSKDHSKKPVRGAAWPSTDSDWISLFELESVLLMKRSNML